MEFITQMRKVKTEARFNSILNDIYDWCDANDVWCGLS